MEISEIEQALERVGLTHDEARIYLMLLRNGINKAGRLSKLAQLNRTTTYDVLNRLLNKGLITYVTKGKVKWFQIINPKQLKGFVKEKEFEVNRILPSLDKLYKTPAEKSNVTLYYGFRGMRAVFEDFLRDTKVHHVLDSEGKFSERMPHFAKHFIRQMEKKKIKNLHLVREGRLVDVSKTTEVRYVKKAVASEAVFDIYNDKIAILIWTDPPEAVLIQNKAAADSLKEYFYMLWRNSRSYSTLNKKNQ